MMVVDLIGKEYNKEDKNELVKLINECSEKEIKKLETYDTETRVLLLQLLNSCKEETNVTVSELVTVLEDIRENIYNDRELHSYFISNSWNYLYNLGGTDYNVLHFSDTDLNIDVMYDYINKCFLDDETVEQIVKEFYN